MPNNQIVVEFENGMATMKAYDAGGQEYDCTAIFTHLRDQTLKTSATSSLTLRANSLETTVQFIPTKKEDTFDVEPAVIAQIIQML